MALPAEQTPLSDDSKKTLSDVEADLFARGLEKLSSKREVLEPMKQATDAKVKEAASEFKQETESWWSRTKAAFSRAASWVTNESEIKKIDAQLQALVDGYKSLADKAVSEKGGGIAVRDESTEKSVEMKNNAVDLFKKLEGKPAQKMVEELFAYKERIGKVDTYGQIGDVQFDERLGQIRIEYADGSSLRKFPNGLVLRVLEGGEIETLEGPFVIKKTKPGPDLRSVGKPPIEPEKPRRVPEWEKDTRLAEKGLKGLEAAKTTAELRAFIIKEGILPAEELAQLTDTEVDARREAIRDEIAAVGGIVVEWIETPNPSPAEQMRKANQAMEAEAAEAGVQEAIDRGVGMLKEEMKEKAEQKVRRARLRQGDAGAAPGTDANPVLLTPDMKKVKNVSDAMVVSETPDWERMTKDAEVKLKALGEATSEEQVKAFLQEHGFETPEALRRMSEEELEDARAAAWETIASKGGIVVGAKPPIPIQFGVPGEKISEAKKTTREIPELQDAIKAKERAEKAVTAPTEAPIADSGSKRVVLNEAARAEMLKNLLNTPKQAEVEAPPAAKAETAKNVVDPKENPLAPESMPAIVDALKNFGKKKDGKFATPAGFRDALVEAGFKLPVTVESEDVKNLHDAYKKAAFGRKKA